jgi:hypothetical protein
VGENLLSETLERKAHHLMGFFVAAKNSNTLGQQTFRPVMDLVPPIGTTVLQSTLVYQCTFFRNYRLVRFALSSQLSAGPQLTKKRLETLISRPFDPADLLRSAFLSLLLLITNGLTGVLFEARGHFAIPL